MSDHHEQNDHEQKDHEQKDHEQKDHEQNGHEQQDHEQNDHEQQGLDGQASEETTQTGKSSGLWRLILFVLVVAGLFVAFRLLPMQQWLSAFFEFIRTLGVWGPLLLGVVYIVATVLMAPGAILTLGAGFTFDLLLGVVTISIASTLGATAAFLVGRNFARGFVEQKVKDNPRFAAIDRAVEASGFKIVLLTRLSPLFPFNLLNYLFSVTNVRTRDYVLASWIGMLPGTVMYVYLGKAAKDITQVLTGQVEGGWGQKALLGVGLVATIAVTITITRIARKALAEYVE